MPLMDDLRKIEPTASPAGLPAIPVVELRAAGPVALLETHADYAALLLSSARRRYTGAFCSLGGRLSRRWLDRSQNPFGHEIEAVAARLGTAAAHFLNLSYEWGCSTGAGPDPAGRGNRMLRTLDWPLDGVGRALVAARQSGPKGEYVNLTWPGFVGVIQAMAPGRFAAAINQAPMRRRGGGRGPLLPLAVDWAANRWQVWTHRGLPPAHLLRQVFERCANFRAARAMLAETPICAPAIFTLSGAGAGESCVIERRHDGTALHDGPTAAANHWLAGAASHTPRGASSHERQALMRARVAEAHRPPGELAWLAPPLLNQDTRLAMTANAACGGLVVQGWERDGAATATLRLAA